MSNSSSNSSSDSSVITTSGTQDTNQGSGLSQIPYKANHSRGKTFAVGCRIHNLLENIRGKVVCRLTPIKFILWGAYVAP